MWFFLSFLSAEPYQTRRIHRSSALVQRHQTLQLPHLCLHGLRCGGPGKNQLIYLACRNGVTEVRAAAMFQQIYVCNFTQKLLFKHPSSYIKDHSLFKLKVLIGTKCEKVWIHTVALVFVF